MTKEADDPDSARGKLYAALTEAQDGACYLCCEPLGERRDGKGDVRFNIDHVWPRSRYRYALRGNCLLAHKPCNVAKGDRDPTAAEVAVLNRVNSALGWQTLPIDRHYENSVPWFTRPSAEERQEQSRQDRAAAAARRAAAEPRPTLADVWPVDQRPRLQTRREAQQRPPVLWQLDDLFGVLRGLYGGGSE